MLNDRKTVRPLLKTLSGSPLVGAVLLCLFTNWGCNGSVATDESAPQESEPQPAATAAADETSSAATAGANPALQAGADSPRPKPLLEDWEAPAAAILLTGEQQGHLEPCGCSERQSGGLARRADFAKQLRARGWPVTGFDLGGAVKRNRRQSELKYEFTRDALNTIGYQGLGFGSQDLRFGPEKLYEWFLRTDVEPDFDLTSLSANVTFFGTRDIGTPLTYRLANVGGVKIAATAVFGVSYRSELFPGGVNPDPSLLRADAPAEVLPAVVAQMEAEQPDVMLLLAYAKPDESEALAKAFPAFNIVVTAGGPEDPVGDADHVGQTLLLRVGTKGKNAGIVGYYPDAKDGKKFRFAVVELDRFRFGHDPAIDDRMRAYQEQLRTENLVETEPPILHPRGAGFRFVGSEKCADCHDEAYDVWKESDHHVVGFKSLTVAFAQASDDPSMASRVRIDRIYDPECICCHTAGWDTREVLRFESGYVSADKTPYLMGVHCENCHGPASRHVELEEAADAAEADLLAEREAMSVTREDAATKVCHQCHDHENSPDFDFEEYWPQIEH